MTIDEHIKILESNAEFERKDGDLQGCLNFRQLAEWLKELKAHREAQVTDAVDRVTIKEYIDSFDNEQMTAEEYRQRMMQAFHNAGCGELIAVCVLPTEKEFDHLEWLLKNHYKKEPCGDAISRQEVLEALDKSKYSNAFCEEHHIDQSINLGMAHIVVNELKPVTPQPEKICVANVHFDEEKLKEICKNAALTILDNSNAPTIEPKMGRWIEYEVDIAPHPLHCSICGFSNHHISNRYIKEFRRCPNCGAKMQEAKE